jgi:hypothetical protein
VRYSVYDYTRHEYDYYEGDGPGGTHAGAPPKPRAVGEIGAAPESSAWKLPAGARKVGSGDMPMGRIASLGGADGDLFSDPMRLATYVAIAYVAWRALR